jgi:hypothetical protein
MNKKHFLAVISAFTLFPVCISWADTQPKNAQDGFQKWIAARIMCQNYPYVPVEMDKKFGRFAKEAGVSLSVKKTENSLTGILTPKEGNTFTLYDLNMENAIFHANEKEHYFYARVKATPKDLLPVITRRQLNLYESRDTQNDNTILHIFPTSRPTRYAPFGQEGSAVIIRKTDQDGVIEVGCKQINYAHPDHNK